MSNDEGFRPTVGEKTTRVDLESQLRELRVVLYSDGTGRRIRLKIGTGCRTEGTKRP
jgi:hypothetical protein